ncbi:Altered inheritance of mitochondria protein 18, mitochondrial [Purpureocillium lavendulum]|uniref:Altered inheritance of mitochondria protein 18, mitochondrial n=1 Tax=Purpureocillium lavendulum TaxID=1247861 RepID=A0AB34FLM1_9HYPO|nr:Altered inheritance of mitochondria protein 18, mitochondrial [Purpureocillium lavendulum]
MPRSKIRPVAAREHHGVRAAMFGRARHANKADGGEQRSYSLDWPTSDRWNPQYNVPRNSLETTPGPSRPHPTIPSTGSQERSEKQQLSSSLRELHVNDGVYPAADEGPWRPPSPVPDDDGLADLSHWLETLGEIYMNNLDNRARWDPRWLNVTRRERYEGLQSTSVTILDYVADEPRPRCSLVAEKQHLAAALQLRPENCKVRVIMVADLSRFVMGALGQLYSIDPEFWFEHLVNSGYAASDSQLKVANAVWMNWAERETRFRHRALPGIGQRTEWNSRRRRAQGRRWVHLRWARLGLLHYLGKKGFHEDEIEKRLGDGRWMVERDVALDKHGLLMTERRLARAKLAKEKQGKKEPEPANADEVTPGRVKASNLYRAYSTFEGLPKNVSAWRNRDLRVVAPEGVSYWSGTDDDGQRTVVLLVDPLRNMVDKITGKLTPALTFMPRALEVESYSEEELWRAPAAEETYLDPPPPPFSKADLKREKKAARKQWLKDRRLRRGGGPFSRDRDRDRDRDGDGGDTFAGSAPKESAAFDDGVSAYTSDDEYDEDYAKELREDYAHPKPHARDRDYARKYALPTVDLLYRHMNTLAAEDVLDGQSLIASLLARMVVDDSLQLLAEMRLQLDYLDNDISAGLYEQLVESIGNSTRQNLSWMRATLRDLRDWSDHVSSELRAHVDADLAEELAGISANVTDLQARAEQTLNLLLASMGLAQSSMVIDQTSGINKLTELAFFFVPISFITSVFSMQVLELTSGPPRIWVWGVSLSTVVLGTYFIRSSLRSPSVRIAVLHCRATINNRFSSSQAGSASRRLNSVGNRAIAKFILFFIGVVGILTLLVVVLFILFFLLFGGIWLGAIATALYFIITRWPEPAVLVPCFLSIPLAGLGMYGTWYWSDEITDWGEAVVEGSAYFIKRIFPAKWTLEKTDDEDLAKEGVNTYARQAMILAT